MLACFLDTLRQQTSVAPEGVLLPPELLVSLRLYRLACIAVAWVLDNFVFDPLLTLIIGDSKFYRLRPYFYNSETGELFKAL